MTLGFIDGLPGLETVFKEEFPHAKVQRCQVHVARNILAKVPKKQKQEVADDIHFIFYASSKKKSLEYFAAVPHWIRQRKMWEKLVKHGMYF